MATPGLLSEWEPTWRERLADALQTGLEGLGVSRYTARRNAQTVTGGASSNLGGAGLLDATPIGLLLGAQEGGLSAGEGVARAQGGDVPGGLLQAGLGALALLPVAGTASKVVKTGVDKAANVTRASRRVGTTGQYVGAPPGVDSPQALGAMVNDYVRGMQEGLPGRNFYTDSSRDIWARTGQDATQADLFAQNLATLSRSNNVGGNTTMSVKGHIQAATGAPVATGRFPSKDSAPLQAMYDAGQVEYLGHKRDPFATQLGVEWAPERVGRGVNDMHEAELMGYPSGKVGGPQQHAFMDEVRARAIEKANAQNLGGFSDWNTGNAQAAAWTGNKIRRGDLEAGDAAKSYADYMPLHEMNATYEAVGAPEVGHLNGLLSAPYEERLAYTLDPRGSWNTSASGRDVGYTAAGMLPGQGAAAPGRFRDTAAPAYVARPVVATEYVPDLTTGWKPGDINAKTGKPTPQPTMPATTQSSLDAVNAVEAARAYFDGQAAGAAHRIMPSRATAYTGAGLDLGRSLTPDEMVRLSLPFEAKGYYTASAPTGLSVLGNEGTASGPALADELRAIVKQNKGDYADANMTLGRVDSVYPYYGDLWQGPPGSVTNSLLDHLAKAPATAGRLEESPAYRAAVVSRNARDLDPMYARYGAIRDDLVRARQIFADEGWDGLRRAAAAGLVPAAALAVGLSASGADNSD